MMRLKQTSLRKEYETITEIVERREEKATSAEVKSFGADFLGILLKAHHDNNDNKKISIDELVEECKSLYFVGLETTSTLLSWTVFLLAQYPDWQEEARKEVLQLFGKQTPNFDGISKLKTMSMIIHESLRLYPPADLFGREVTKEVRLGNILVPEGVELVVPTLALHHDPRVWGQDAALFKPERFSEGIAKATNDNMASFIPFGMGPTNCVGMNFGSSVAKIALSMTLQRYSFTLSPGYVHSPFQFLTLRPQYGVQLILRSL